jgi:hypothetical protein
MDDTSFLQKLRMQNIFPSGGGPREGTPFGMPDFGSDRGIDPGQIFEMMQQNKDLDMQRQLNMARRSPQLQNISQSAMSSEQPKQVLFRDDPNKITPYQQAQLNISRERLGQQGELGQERIETTKRGQDISQQRANIYEFKAKNPNSRIITPGDGRVYAVNPVTNEKVDLGIDTLSDQEKLELQGQNAMNRVEAVTERGKEARKETGQQRLGEIAARESNIRGRNITKAPTKSGQQVTAQELINTRPDLAKYITFTPEGLVQIDPKTPPVEMEMIQNAIYSKKQNRDVQLPKSTGAPVSKTPKSTIPTAADLIKKYGG